MGETEGESVGENAREKTARRLREGGDCRQVSGRRFHPASGRTGNAQQTDEMSLTVYQAP